VHKAVLVGALQAEGRLADDLAGVGHPQRAAAAQHLLQVQTIQKFHHQATSLANFPRIQGANDV
jgi:hypothetical protein